MDTKQLLKKTLEIDKKMSGYDKFQRLADAMEELGETAAAMVVVEGVKKTNDPKKQYTVRDVADGLADTMYTLILLADQYGVDLFQEYGEMIERLQKRVESGEFRHD